MTHAPNPDKLLAAVIGEIENTIAPAVADAYAASMCRTAAQMLRQLSARLTAESAQIERETGCLRVILADLDEPVGPPPPLTQPDPAAARAYLSELESALAARVLAEPDPAAPSRVAANQFLAMQLSGRTHWERDAYTGPRR